MAPVFSVFSPFKNPVYNDNNNRERNGVFIFSLASYVSPENQPSAGGDRKKWEAGVVLVPSVAQQTLEQTSFATIGEPANESARVDVPNSGPDLFLDLVPRGTFQSKQMLPSSRCAGCTKKPRGRRGR